MPTPSERIQSILKDHGITPPQFYFLPNRGDSANVICAIIRFLDEEAEKEQLKGDWEIDFFSIRN